MSIGIKPKKQDKKSDKRRYPRLIKSLPINFTLSEINLPSTSIGTQYKGRTHDIGIGGVSFDILFDDRSLVKELETKKKKIDSNIRLIEKNSDLDTEANLVWIYNLKGLSVNTKYAVGLKFIHMKKTAKNILTSYIQEIITLKQEQYLKHKQKIKQTLAKIARVDVSSFSENTLIREELGVDSLMAMEILAAIETIYNIEIDESKAFDIITVGDMIHLIEEYLEQKQEHKESFSSDNVMEVC